MNRPKLLKKLLLTLVFAIVSYFIQLHYPLVAFCLLILLILMIGATEFSNFASPSKTKSEWPILFALFWGMLIGLLLPFVIEEYLL